MERIQKSQSHNLGHEAYLSITPSIFLRVQFIYHAGFIARSSRVDFPYHWANLRSFRCCSTSVGTNTYTSQSKPAPLVPVVLEAWCPAIPALPVDPRWLPVWWRDRVESFSLNEVVPRAHAPLRDHRQIVVRRLTNSITSHTNLLLKYFIGVHWICSRACSSCSFFSVSWMKICCNFSLAWLIHSCSKLFLSKISKP